MDKAELYIVYYSKSVISYACTSYLSGYYSDRNNFTYEFLNSILGPPLYNIIK